LELKVVCNCGQKYKFEVEPANGRMPFAVSCPVCGVDGTPLANAILTQSFPRAAAAAVAPAPVATAAPPAIIPPPIAAAPKPGQLAGVLTKAKSPGEGKLGLGIAGAVIGAAVGGSLMYGFFEMANFRFPLMGTGIGALAGLGARLLYKGRGSTLAGVTAGIALAATAGTLYLIFQEMAGQFAFSIIASASVAYKIAK
jgi:hypothetical protein